MTVLTATHRFAIPLLVTPVLTAAGQVHIPASDADTTMSSLSVGSAFAESITIIDDCDGDGWRDIVVGALAHDPIGDGGLPVTNAGSALLFSGLDGSFIRSFDGEQEHGNLGVAAIQIADRDGDDVPDLIVTVPRLNGPGQQESGGFVVFSTASGAVLDVVHGDLGAGTLMGSSIASVGDLDGDGVAEFVVGASGVGQGGDASPGYARLYDGATHGVLHTFTGESPGSIFGASVAGCGDTDDDGVGDILIGAPLQEIVGPGVDEFLDAGRAYVFSGADYTLRYAVHRYTNPVDTPFANFGTAVAALSDLDDDGFGDFIVGAPEGQQGSGGNGSVVVYSGADGSVLHDVEGAFATGEQHGSAVAGTGDLDGDGVPDFAGGSSQQCFGFCSSREGQVIVYSGATGDVIEYFDGAELGDAFGVAFAVDDLNGDGGVDFVIGAPFNDDGPMDPGLVYVFRGEPAPVAGDATGDGTVNVDDVLAILAVWGPCPRCLADLDGDGTVGVNDLLAVLAGWSD